MPAQAIPDGYRTVTPYLAVRGAAEVVEFAQRAFDARVGHLMRRPDGAVMHAELTIGDSIVMVGEVMPPNQPKPCMLYLYVHDADGVHQRALKAGGSLVSEMKDEFYGDRVGAVKDRSGVEWWIATHVEDVSPEEMERRASAMAR
jgi:uncharacterized glyoxalase superfamily protein PhnB